MMWLRLLFQKIQQEREQFIHISFFLALFHRATSFLPRKRFFLTDTCIHANANLQKVSMQIDTASFLR